MIMDFVGKDDVVAYFRARSVAFKHARESGESRQAPEDFVGHIVIMSHELYDSVFYSSSDLPKPLIAVSFDAKENMDTWNQIAEVVESIHQTAALTDPITVALRSLSVTPRELLEALAVGDHRRIRSSVEGLTFGAAQKLVNTVKYTGPYGPKVKVE